MFSGVLCAGYNVCPNAQDQRILYLLLCLLPQDVPGDIHPKLWEDAVNVHKEAIALWQTPTHSNLSSCVGCVFTPVPSSCAGDELANETICIGYLYEHCTAGSLESLLG